VDKKLGTTKYTKKGKTTEELQNKDLFLNHRTHRIHGKAAKTSGTDWILSTA